jgi:hypothetical protein
MREFSFVIAAVAGLALLAAAFAWFKIGRNPKNDLTAGRGGRPETRRLRTASRLLMAALFLSGLAAIVAVSGSMLRIFKV